MNGLFSVKFMKMVKLSDDEAITTDIISQNGAFSGNFQVCEVNGPEIKSENNFEKKDAITKEKQSIKANGNKIAYSFFPHSFTMIKGKIMR